MCVSRATNPSHNHGNYISTMWRCPHGAPDKSHSDKFKGGYIIKHFR